MAVRVSVLKEIKAYEKTLITAFAKNNVIVCFNVDSKESSSFLKDILTESLSEILHVMTRLILRYSKIPFLSVICYFATCYVALVSGTSLQWLVSSTRYLSCKTDAISEVH